MTRQPLNRRKSLMPDYTNFDRTKPLALKDAISMTVGVAPGKIFQAHPKVQAEYFRRLEKASEAVRNGEIPLAKDRK